MAKEIHPAITIVKDLAQEFARKNYPRGQTGKRKDISGWNYDVFIVQLSLLNRAWEEGWCEPEPTGELMMSDEELQAENIRGR